MRLHERKPLLPFLVLLLCAVMLCGGCDFAEEPVTEKEENTAEGSDIPVKPENSQEPENPQEPEDYKNPEEPEGPDNPEIPDEPDNPEIPDEPQEPDPIAVMAITCDEEGIWWVTLADGRKISCGDVKPTCEHRYEATETAIPPTCLLPGGYLEVCAVCQAEHFVLQSALGHSPVADAAVEPDCTNSGLTEGSHCETCGAVLIAQEYRDPLNHDWEYHEAKAPTCTEDGYEAYQTCKRCTATTKEILPAKGHTDKLISVLTESDIRYAGGFVCETCNRSEVRSIETSELSVPILDLQGSLTGISKDNKVKITASYRSETENFDCDATLKWQGGSSISYAKKNYNIQFYKSGTDFAKKYKVELVEGWGEESKYTLKANYVDFSESRNVVAAKLWGEVVHSRGINDELNGLINGGAIDGFPILVYQDGQYQGLYTLNIPKDDWLFGMDGENEKEAILMGNTWSDAVALYTETAADLTSSGWELEYCSTEDDTAWVAESFNEMVRFVNGNSGEAFRNGIGEYVNVDRAIDWMLFTIFIHANDNTSKNVLWVTYDGTTWTPSMYDMDGTFGMHWSGKYYYAEKDFISQFTRTEKIISNALWNKLISCYPDEVKARYAELRGSVLSLANIDRAFSDFIGSIPPVLYEAEREKWPEVPSADTNHLAGILSYMKTRCGYLDTYFDYTSAENPKTVQFVLPEGAAITVYPTGDLSHYGNTALSVFARDGDSGYLASDGNGQVNFVLSLPAGYRIAEIKIDGNYKNCKTPAETGVPGLYRITKISSDLKVTVTLEQNSVIGDTDPQGGDTSFLDLGEGKNT